MTERGFVRYFRRKSPVIRPFRFSASSGQLLSFTRESQVPRIEMELHRVRLVQLVVLMSAVSSLAAPENSGQQAKSEMRCLDTARHKAQPLPEPGIYKTCGAYESLSCCTNETASRIHGNDLYKLDQFICNNKPMSAECKKFFMLDACLYECSPQLGPWIQVDSANETTLKNIPLCQSDCEKWFLACSKDFTCVKDWTAYSGNFKCSEADKCQTFKDKFQNAAKFCQKIWNNAYEVVPDDSKCFKIDVSKNDTPDSGHDNTISTPKPEPNSSSNIVYNIIVVSVASILALSNK